VAHRPGALPLIGLAGAAGAAVRWAVLEAGGLSANTGAPLDALGRPAGLAGATLVALLAINVLGSAVAGGAIEAARRGRWTAHRTSAVVIGFCGGLTTFSTVTVEVARGITGQRALGAMAYLLASLAVSVVAVLAGRRVIGWRLGSGSAVR
jgi:fluoride ion exporter CrcB/FEX